MDNITPLNLCNELKKSIIGQDRYLKDLSTALWMHYLKYSHYVRTGEHIAEPRTNILAIGKSGSGKTKAIELLAESILNLPLVVANASTLTGAGWHGEDVDSLALRASKAAGGDESLEQYAVIVLDESDKLFTDAYAAKTSFSPVNNLLTFIGGTEVTFKGFNKDSQDSNNMITINTSHMLFIFLGAFDGMEEIIRKRLSGKSCIGFGTSEYKEPPQKDILKYVTKDDLHKFGMSWELLGRIQVVTSLNELTADDYKKILTESEESAIKQYDNLFCQTLNAHISITDAAVIQAVKEAEDNEMGARGLNQIIAKVLQPAVYSLGEDDSICEIVVDFSDGELAANKIYGKRIKQDPPKEELSAAEQEILQSVPLVYVSGYKNIKDYAESIKASSERAGKMLHNMASAATYVLAAAVAGALINRKSYMTMDMLYKTLHAMPQDDVDSINKTLHAIPQYNIDMALSFAGLYDNFLRQAQSYGMDFHYARKAAEEMLMDYCRHCLFNPEIIDRSAIEERELLDSVPFCCEKDKHKIWQYATVEIGNASPQIRTFSQCHIGAVFNVLSAAVCLQLMDEEEPYPTMLDLHDKLDDILTEDREMDKKPLLMFYKRFLENAKMHEYNLGSAVKTTKSVLLAYCRRCQDRMQKDA